MKTTLQRTAQEFLLLFLFCYSLTAQPSDVCPLKIGMNIAGMSDWGTENPFVDLMKSSREWLTANSVWVDGGINPWDTGIIDSIPRDAQGYPLELPYAVAGQETTQVVHTVWANTSSLQAGEYICLYEGDGELEFNFDGSILRQAGNRIVVGIQPNENIMQLVVRRSNRMDHVRNIRILMPGTEWTYLSQPYNPVWIQQLSPFKTIRFMDWGATNNSPLTTWAERAHQDYYTWTTSKGVPYEEMVRLCNTIRADAWVCVPHLADSEYIRQMAILLRDNIGSGLKIYVEYSNENWNWMFNQTNYLYDTGDQGVPWPERIVPFIQRVMDIWTDVFQGQMHRLVRVVGGQHYWPDVCRRIALTMRTGSFDAFSPAAYVGFGEYGNAVITAQGASLSPQTVIELARREMDTVALPLLQELKETICDVRNVQLVYYEGGQHLTPDPFGTDQPYNQALEEAQSLPEMYTLYNDWLARLRTLSENSLFMNFSFAGSKSGKYGSWGVLEYIGQKINEAPKYRALIDNLCGSTSVPQTTPEQKPISSVLYQNYPNPFNPGTTIKYRVSAYEHIALKVYDLLGREIRTFVYGVKAPGLYTIYWDGTDSKGQPVSSGVYSYQIRNRDRILSTKKMLLMK